MTTYDQVIQAIFDAIREANETLSSDEALTESPDTVIAGQSGTLDSLVFVNLAVAVEQGVEDPGSLPNKKTVAEAVLARAADPTPDPVDPSSDPVDSADPVEDDTMAELMNLSRDDLDALAVEHGVNPDSLPNDAVAKAILAAVGP